VTETQKTSTNSKIFALRAAQWIGCNGAHKDENGKWMPCATHNELMKISNRAEPRKKTALEDIEKNIKRRNKKSKKKQWENLRETTPLGFSTLTGGGIVSAPIVSMKGIIPGLSPRDSDDDVYTDIESARKRSVRLGCIGVRRLSSQSGKLVWMPCTNNTDYARLAGTTSLGRRNQRETNSRAIRTIVRQELNRRKKSLFEELHETKGIGKRIGRALTPNKKRTRGRAMSQIAGELDPRKRRDVDNDGLIFDGTWREMAAPARGLRSGASGPLDSDAVKKPFASPKISLSDITKGGPFKAKNILELNFLRGLTREEKATKLGVSTEVFDAMNEVDASLDTYAADRLAVNVLGINPSNIWPMFYDTDVSPEQIGVGKPISKQTEEIMKLRSQGMSFDDIAKKFGITRQGAQSAYSSGVRRNSLVPPTPGMRSPRGTRSQSSSSRQPMTRGDGMIQRDERGIPIKQRDVRKDSMESIVKKLKDIGMSDSEIDVLLTGQSPTKATGLRSASGRPSRPNADSPDTWPTSTKTHYLDWARARPNFVVPYSLVKKFDAEQTLTNREWRLLKQFYTRYSGDNRGLRSRTNINTIANIGAKRVSEIILEKVNPESIKPDGEKRHYFIVGAPGMGKTTLTDFLAKRGLIPNDTEAAHIDPDFIKQALDGYDAGTGAITVHRESAKTATEVVGRAANRGMDIVTQGTGTRLPEYKTTNDPRYQTIAHAAFVNPDIAQSRLDARQKIDGRMVAGHILPHIANISYNLMTDYLKNNKIGSFFLWDNDVPLGAAPKLIAKVENGVFSVNDEEKFMSWSTGGRKTPQGVKNLEYYKRKWR